MLSRTTNSSTSFRTAWVEYWDKKSIERRNQFSSNFFDSNNTDDTPQQDELQDFKDAAQRIRSIAKAAYPTPPSYQDALDEIEEELRSTFSNYARSKKVRLESGDLERCLKTLSNKSDKNKMQLFLNSVKVKEDLEEKLQQLEAKLSRM